jgi:hypothetical protein
MVVLFEAGIVLARATSRARAKAKERAEADASRSAGAGPGTSTQASGPPVVEDDVEREFDQAIAEEAALSRPPSPQPPDRA